MISLPGRSTQMPKLSQPKSAWKIVSSVKTPSSVICANGHLYLMEISADSAEKGPTKTKKHLFVTNVSKDVMNAKNWKPAWNARKGLQCLETIRNALLAVKEHFLQELVVRHVIVVALLA